MQGLDPGPDGRRAIAFDLAHVTATHSGTSELARALVRRAGRNGTMPRSTSSPRPRPSRSISANTTPPCIGWTPPIRGASRCSFGIGQPFLWGEMERAVLRAPVLVFFMLDTIGFDCLAHAPDELDALWRFALSEADGLLFNSDFTRRQFARRFSIRAGLPCRSSLHSLDLAEYRDAAGDRDADAEPPTDRGASGKSGAEAVAPDGSILVIGNGFSHKHVRETATLLAAAGLSDRVVVLGLPPGAVDGITAIPSGTLDGHRTGGSVPFGQARGLSLRLRGFRLSHPRGAGASEADPRAASRALRGDRGRIARKPQHPPFRKTMRSCSTCWHKRSAGSRRFRLVRPRNWDDATSDLSEVVAAALAGVSYDRVLRRLDMLRGRMAYMRARARRTG